MNFNDLNFDPQCSNGTVPAIDVITSNIALFDNDFPLVLCCGDSFTHGHGLADYLIDGYPGDRTFTFDDPDIVSGRIKWGAAKRQLLFPGTAPNQMLIRQLWMIERQLAWPNVMQNHRTDINVLNLSCPGGCVERAARLLVEWALTVKLLVPHKKITLICGNTFHWRHELLSTQAYTMFVPPLELRRDANDSEKLLHDLCLRHWDEDKHLHFYFKEISWLIGIAKLNQFRMLFTTCGTDCEIDRQSNVFKRYKHLLDGVWPGELMFSEKNYNETDKVTVYDGHLSAMVHKSFGATMACKI